MPSVVGHHPNTRVTFNTDPNNARSESSIAVNPSDNLNMVAGSKRFTNLSTYAFSLAAYATFDGGRTWIETPLELLPDWAGTSDPAITWDSLGIAYLVALPFRAPGWTAVGIAVYKSTDGGRSWSSPNLIHTSSDDDKQWAAGDVSPASPHCGNIYAVWDDGPGPGKNLCFARTTDHGSTWKGTGADVVGSVLATDSFSPELSVARDGTIYVVWISGTQIKFVKSTNGGDSFAAPVIVASGISRIPQKLPGGKFRTFSLPTGCTGVGGNVLFAWADHREGVSRIYYRYSTNGGDTWQGSSSGKPLLTGQAVSGSNQHDFHPQIISTPNGQIGCAFYEFGPKSSNASQPPLIDVVFAFSIDNGQTFPYRKTVTDTAWDPALNAPLARGDPNTTFIGDYFGLDASKLGFFPLWTDTRTGMQELFVAGLNEIVIYSLKKIISDKGISFPVSMRGIAHDLGLSPPISIKDLVRRLLQ